MGQRKVMHDDGDDNDGNDDDDDDDTMNPVTFQEPSLLLTI